MVADRASVVDDGRKEADQIIADARSRARGDPVRHRHLPGGPVGRPTSSSSAPATESDGLRRETDEYVDGKLANFEITLDKTIDAVRRGRERLAGRTDMHGITDDEVDKIVLPEHLDGTA